MFGKMQESGLIEIIALVRTSAVWGQYPKSLRVLSRVAACLMNIVVLSALGSLSGAVMWRLGGGNILFSDKSRLCFSFWILLCFTSRDWIGGENGHTLVCFLWSFAQFCHRGLGMNTIWVCFLASRMIAQLLLLKVVLRCCLFLRFGFHEYFNQTMTNKSKITNSLMLTVN